MQPLDRRHFIAALGGATAVSLMSHEARADALEHALMGKHQRRSAGRIRHRCNHDHCGEIPHRR